MRSRLSALVAVALLAALVVPAAVGAKPAQSAARAEHARILAYWTPQRIANAVPRDFVRTDAGFTLAPTPRARPGSGSGVTGASWTLGGDALNQTGKVLFSMGGGDWICSGSVINDGNDAAHAIVLSAGHCTVDESTGEFATNWMFFPAFDTAPTYDCDANAHGCWTAVSLVVRSEYANAGGFTYEATRHDWGFAVVEDGDQTGTQLDAGGSFTLDTSTATTNPATTMWAFGYPAAQKYKGYDLVYCTGAIGYDPSNDNLTYSMPCDMTGGSSGGPWFSGTSQSDLASANSAAKVRSLNSYGYSGVKKMFGPFFNAETLATYNAALAADGSTYGIEVGP